MILVKTKLLVLWKLLNTNSPGWLQIQIQFISKSSMNTNENTVIKQKSTNIITNIICKALY